MKTATKARPLRVLAIAVAICVLACPAVVFFFLDPIYPDGARNQILGTLSQVLAGVFGITLAGVFLALQLISSYSSRLVLMNRAVLWGSMLYLGMFVPAITLPIVTLRHPVEPLLSASLLFGVAMLIAFPLYLVFLVQQLEAPKLVHGLTRQILHLARHSKSAETEIQTLYNYLHFAFKSGDYDTIGLGIDAFLNTVIEAAKGASNFRFQQDSFTLKWIVLAGDDEMQMKGGYSQDELTMMESLLRVGQVSLFAGNDTSVNIAIFCRLQACVRTIMTTEPQPVIVDYLLINLSIMLMIMTERRMNDAIWFSLRILRIIGEVLAELCREEPVAWKIATQDYLSVLICVLLATEAYLPTYSPTITALIQDIETKLEPAAKNEAGHQADEFMREVFPDIPVSLRQRFRSSTRRFATRKLSLRIG